MPPLRSSISADARGYQHFAPNGAGREVQASLAVVSVLLIRLFSSLLSLLISHFSFISSPPSDQRSVFLTRMYRPSRPFPPRSLFPRPRSLPEFAPRSAECSLGDSGSDNLPSL